MSTELKIRRDSNANLLAMVPAEAEMGYDQTNKRLIVGDGIEGGGIAIPSAKDLQNQTMIAVNAGGSANALTMTLNAQYAPVAYASLQRFTFKAIASNTAAATMNVNGLGAKNIKKVINGVKTALAAGDITTGIIYDVQYDGTEFQLLSSELFNLTTGSVTQAHIAANTIGQSELRTADGDVSRAFGLVQTSILLPGGAYGFYPRVRASVTARAADTKIFGLNISLPTSNAAYIHVDTSDYPSGTWYANQTYVTASPPYDLGDGEIPLFAFALVNAAGDILSTWVAQDPPWANNGPTNIAPDVRNEDGEKFKRVRVLEADSKGTEATIKQAALDVARKVKKLKPTDTLVEVLLPLDQTWKNADMDLFPHPFQVNTGETVVLLDTQAPLFAKLLELQQAGESASELIHEWMTVDNKELKNRKSPPGVMQVDVKWRNTKKA